MFQACLQSSESYLSLLPKNASYLLLLRRRIIQTNSTWHPWRTKHSWIFSSRRQKRSNHRSKTNQVLSRRDLWHPWINQKVAARPRSSKWWTAIWKSKKSFYTLVSLYQPRGRKQHRLLFNYNKGSHRFLLNRIRCHRKKRKRNRLLCSSFQWAKWK